MSRISSKSKQGKQTFESIAERRQREFEKTSAWSTQNKYYQMWGCQNDRYQHWTSPEYYIASNQQYTEIKRRENKKITLEERRKKLRKLLFDEEQQLETEVTLSPRESKTKLSTKSTEVLKDINIGLKLAEEDRRRHEAEIQLYNQWRQNNPIIRDFESNQHRAGLKLAWLDQQIEKRMAKEKNEEELKHYLQERDKLIQEDKELERRENEELSKREQEMMNAIQMQMEEMKIKDHEALLLKQEEQETMEKNQKIEEMLQKRNENLQRRRDEEFALYNLNQSKHKLRQRTHEVEMQLKEDQRIIEEIQNLKPWHEIECQNRKLEMQQNIQQFLNTLREQKNLETQRQKYISFIFDSEAKDLFERQDRLWRQEQETRNKLIQQVIEGLREQMRHKINKNVQKQNQVLQEREEMLHQIEDYDLKMKQMQEMLREKKLQRKMELEKQIQDKRLDEKKREMEEEKRRQDELENIKREEDRIKQEILKMQKREYPVKQKYNRRILW